MLAALSQTGTLVAAVEELRAAEAAEAALRAAAEAGLREAAAAFKAEMYEKMEHLASLRAQVKQLQAWQRATLVGCNPDRNPYPSEQSGLRAKPARTPQLMAPQRPCSPTASPRYRMPSPSPPRARSPLSLRKSAGAYLEGCGGVWATQGACDSPSREPGVPARDQDAGGAKARWQDVLQPLHRVEEDAAGTGRFL